MDAWNDYFQPGSNVLKNIPGFTTNEELRKFEYAASRERAQALRADPVQGRYDLAHFREVHRRLFQDVYAWAGELRTVEMSKGGTGFAPLTTPAHTLASWTQTVLDDLRKENHLKGLKTNEFVERLTHHYGELNFAHPYREGNGRATKEFLAQMGKEAGYQIEFDRVSAKQWNDAAARQGNGDASKIKDVFDKIVMPSRAVALRDEPISEAVRRFPELQGAANALEAARQKAERMHAVDRRAFLAEVQSTLLARLQAGDIIQAPTAKRDAAAQEPSREPGREPDKR
jgi:cell filamentation protein